MAIISPPPATGPPATEPRLALAVADANWFSTENLFREARRDDVATLLLTCADYYNIDDYAQYWPRWARRVDELERQAVRDADLTVCVSLLRAEALRAAVPDAAERVRHLPHGSPAASLGEHAWDRPAPAPADLAG